MNPFMFRWTSKICECTSIFCEDKIRHVPCDGDHTKWCEIIGDQEIAKKLMLVQSTKISKSFRYSLVRYGAKGKTFHRPQSVKFDEASPSAELGFYLSESLGVYLTSCSDPERYADYLANKACRGLTEKMWLEDWQAGRHNLFPAELVADPNLCLPRKEANQLFGINLDPEFVAVFKSIRRQRQAGLLSEAA